MEKEFPLIFGDSGQYELSKQAFEHIISGETSIRPVITPTGKINETVLSGGLHTYDGWQRFLALHPNVVHLTEFRVGIHDAWWFARELQNGAITLKIPRHMFTKGAAGITRQPDNYYKSGYLWKTLFPRAYSDCDILNAISEALQNIDRELSDALNTENPDGVLYGYTALADPLTAMLIRIQVRGNQILSAFPAWDQPFTGNNGKAYSHIHSISFLIAESVVDIEKFQLPYGPVFQGNRFNAKAILEITPSFIKSRRRRNTGDPVQVRNAARANELRRFAGRATTAELDIIDRYLADYVCAKDPFAVQRGMYSNILEELERWPELYNASQVTENIGECLWILGYCDVTFNTRRSIDVIVRFLGQALVHTGGLNTLMFKALIGDMVTLAISHIDPNGLKDVLAALATSPCRAALYTEFDLSPFIGRRENEANTPAYSDLELTVDHLLEFLASNLGENYLIAFDKDRRLDFAREYVNHGDQWRMARDVMSKLAPRDFDFFMPEVLDLSELKEQTPPEEDDLLLITRDYGRMMAMMRQRVVLEDPSAYRAKLEDLKEGTEEYDALERKKFKHLYVKYMHVRMLTTVRSYADKVGYLKLSSACEQALHRLPKERIPLPRPIPDYIHVQRRTQSHPLATSEIDVLSDQSDDDAEIAAERQ